MKRADASRSEQYILSLGQGEMKQQFSIAKVITHLHAFEVELRFGNIAMELLSDTACF